jgi:hypothetical protein
MGFDHWDVAMRNVGDAGTSIIGQFAKAFNVSSFYTVLIGQFTSLLLILCLTGLREIYPFTNTAIEALALDKKLRKTWELVGGDLSHQPVALVKAYLYTKLRCHFALLGSMQKSFGIREEHRISRALIHKVDHHIRSPELHNRQLTVLADDNSPYCSFTTSTLRVGSGEMSINSVWGLKWCIAFKTFIL